MDHGRARIAEGMRNSQPHTLDADGLSNLHKLLGLIPPVKAQPPREPVARFPVRATAAAENDGGSREWSSTIALVQTATEGLRQIEERIRQAEAQSVALSQRAFDELKAAEARIHNLEARARAAEARALEAENRLRESDDWLTHFQETILQKLAARRACHAGEVVKLRPVG